MPRRNGPLKSQLSQCMLMEEKSLVGTICETGMFQAWSERMRESLVRLLALKRINVRSLFLYPRPRAWIGLGRLSAHCSVYREKN